MVVSLDMASLELFPSDRSLVIYSSIGPRYHWQSASRSPYALSD
ncbi:hypothetical protein RSAG8_09268, partial [Rhizoctonia solani AG-8 WAC10335]